MATHKCPKCGLELPEGEVGKLCPACVLGDVIQHGTEDELPEITGHVEVEGATVKVSP